MIRFGPSGWRAVPYEKLTCPAARQAVTAVAAATDRLLAAPVHLVLEP